MGWSLLAGVLVAGVAAAVIYPLFRPPLEPVGDAPGPAARLAALEDRKAAIYGQIRDLGHDLRMDKLTEGDYRRESEILKAQAVEVLAEIERLREEVPRAGAAVEARIAEIRARMEGGALEVSVATDDGHHPGPAAFCTACGRRAGAEDRFCAGCGASLGGRG